MLEEMAQLGHFSLSLPQCYFKAAALRFSWKVFLTAPSLIFTCNAPLSESFCFFCRSFMESKQDFQIRKRFREHRSIYLSTSGTGLDIKGTESCRVDYMPEIHRTLMLLFIDLFQRLKLGFFVFIPDIYQDIRHHATLYNHSGAWWFKREYYNYTQQPLSVDRQLCTTWWNTHTIKAQESAS